MIYVLIYNIMGSFGYHICFETQHMEEQKFQVMEGKLKSILIVVNWERDSSLTFLRETLFKTEDIIGAETLTLHFIAIEIGYKNFRICSN